MAKSSKKSNKGEPMYEDWRKEYEKVKLSQKYSKASTQLSKCYAQPTLQSIKKAYARVMDYIMSMPLPLSKQDDRDDWTDDLDDIKYILYGADKDKKKRKARELGVQIKKKRRGMKYVDVPVNLPMLADKLREVLDEAGSYATSQGLRVRISRKSEVGMKKILDQEGMGKDVLDEVPG